MKKIISFALVLAMLLTMLVGCGSAGKELNKAGTYTGEYDVLTITAADTVLENATANKIVIAKEVGDGDVTLKNVTVDTLEVYGGGENSIHLLEAVVKAVVSHKEEGIVRIVAEAMTSVETFDSTNTIVEVAAGANVGTVTANANTTVTVFPEAVAAEVVVADTTAAADIQGQTAKVTVDAPAATVAVAETAKVETVAVTEKAEEAVVEIKGEVAAVAVEAPKAAVAVAETATVAEVKVAETATAAKAVLAGTVTKTEIAAAQTEVKVAQTAKVEEVKVTEKANDTALVVEGTVTKVDTEATTTVTGNGTVEKVETSNKNNVTLPENSNAAQNTTVTQKPNTTTPAPEVKPETKPEVKPETKPEETTPSTPSAPSHSHSYTTVVSETAATCTAEGQKVLKCSCGATKTEVIPALGHTMKKVDAKAATCTEKGAEAGEKCSVCGTVTGCAEIAALGHDVDIDGKCKRENCGWYVVDTQEELAAAINAATGAATIELGEGNYTMVAVWNKEITLTGTAGTVLSLPCKTHCNGATINFKGMTIQGYTGADTWYTEQLAHATKATYEDCKIIDLITTYCPSDFTNCAFENTSTATADWYSVFVYGTNCNITNCTFNTTASKAVKIYSEGTQEATLNVTGCKFYGTFKDKAAVEIDSTHTTKYIVNISNCEINEHYTDLWKDKSTKSTVTVDGVQVFPQ